MSTFFQDKLVAGHTLFSTSKATLLGTMQAHPLLTSNYAHRGNLAEYREFGAALLWLDARPLSPAVIRQLKPEARITLCVMLGLPSRPVAIQSQSDRILKYIQTKRSANASSAAAAAAKATSGSLPGASAAPASGGPKAGALPGGGATGATSGGSGTTSSGGVLGAPLIGSGLSGASAPSILVGNGAGALSSGGGGGGGGSGLPPPLPTDLVTPAQLAMVAAMDPAIVRQLVRAAQIPVLAANSDERGTSSSWQSGHPGFDLGLACSELLGRRRSRCNSPGPSWHCDRLGPRRGPAGGGSLEFKHKEQGQPEMCLEAAANWECEESETELNKRVAAGSDCNQNRPR